MKDTNGVGINLAESVIGAYTSNDGFLSSKEFSDRLKFVVEKDSPEDGIQIIRLKVTNISNKSIKINSLLIGEFEIKSVELKEVLANEWTQSGFSGYVSPSKYTKRRKFFLKRDQNPFSFRKDFGYLKRSIVSEWYTQLVFIDKAVVIGAITTKDQYTQVFVKAEKGKSTIRITSQLDGITISPKETVFSEKIAIITGSKEDTLDKFVKQLKLESNIEKNFSSPRGLCCAYYAQGNKVDQKYVMEQLEVIDKTENRFKIDYIQIDAGYSVWGDWLDYRTHFPKGLKFIVDEVKKRGMKAGIWIAPFIAVPESNLFKNHNEWFLKDDSGKDFETRFSSPIDFIKPLQLRVLDITLKEVQQYIANVIKHFAEVGFELVKIDFTYPLGFSTNFRKSMTRAQALRQGLDIIRSVAGDNVKVLTAITQLSPVVGIGNFVRVGGDSTSPLVYGIPILNRIVNNFMLREDLRNTVARKFFNRQVWLCDADCLVFNKRAGLTKKMRESHVSLVLKMQGTTWFGDDLKKNPGYSL